MIKAPRHTVDDLRLIFRYDADSGELVWNGKGPRQRDGVVCGSVCKDGYRRVFIDGESLSCHRIAWALHYGEWPRAQIDHINRNRADNRIVNLRDATGSQNCTNRLMPSRHGLVGVALLRSGRWQAQAEIEGVCKYLGTFATKELAHAEYLRYVRQCRGEFLPHEVQP